jgi:hypothetical protein
MTDDEIKKATKEPRGTYVLRTACGCTKEMDVRWPPETRSVMVAIPLGRRDWAIVTRPGSDVANVPKHNTRQFDIYSINWDARRAEFREVLP